MIVIQEPLASWLMLLARICLAGVYLVSGVHKAFWYEKAAQEFHDARVPVIGFFLPLTIGLHLLGGLALVTGIFVAEAALALAVFTILSTLKVHSFWRMSGQERLARSRVAMAHLAVVGGLLLLAVVGPGRFVW